MASSDMIKAILSTFAAQWHFDFDPNGSTWARQVATWTDRLRPFEDDVVERAVNDYLDTESRAPQVADIRTRCISFRPREVSAPAYLDSAPRQGQVDAAQVDIYPEASGPKKERWTHQQHVAARRWEALIAEVYAARQTQDDERLTRARLALADARSPQAYRRWQVYWLEKERPGAGLNLPPLPAVCDLCHGHLIVQVPHRLVRSVPFHWSRLTTGKDDRPNSVGVLFHCPRCVTPTKDEHDDYTAPEAEYQTQSQEAYA